MTASSLSTKSNAVKAQLSWNTPGEFVYNGIYDSQDTESTEEAWENLRYDVGSIALSDEYVKSTGLPIAQRFPWDESKGLYFISAYHSIHCLVCDLCLYSYASALTRYGRRFCVLH